MSLRPSSTTQSHNLRVRSHLRSSISFSVHVSTDSCSSGPWWWPTTPVWCTLQLRPPACMEHLCSCYVLPRSASSRPAPTHSSSWKFLHAVSACNARSKSWVKCTCGFCSPSLKVPACYSCARNLENLFKNHPLPLSHRYTFALAAWLLPACLHERSTCRRPHLCPQTLWG